MFSKSVPESSPTVSYQLLQGEGVVRKTEVHSLGYLRRMVEIKNHAVPVIALVDEVQQDLHHSVQELAGRVFCLQPASHRKNIYKICSYSLNSLLRLNLCKF